MKEKNQRFNRDNLDNVLVQLNQLLKLLFRFIVSCFVCLGGSTAIYVFVLAQPAPELMANTVHGIMVLTFAIVLVVVLTIYLPSVIVVLNRGQILSQEKDEQTDKQNTSACKVSLFPPSTGSDKKRKPTVVVGHAETFAECQSNYHAGEEKLQSER